MITNEIIRGIKEHYNADSLEIADVLGYDIIVKKGEYSEGDDILLIHPDTVMKKHPSLIENGFEAINGKRIKARRIRDVWSFGVVLPLTMLDISHELYYTKEEIELLKETGGIKFSNFPTFLIKSDEKRYNYIDLSKFEHDYLVTKKYDGSSTTFFHNEGASGICSRNTLIEKKDKDFGHFYIGDTKYDILNKLSKLGRNLAIQGETYGSGINKSNPNDDAKQDLNFVAFNIIDIDKREYLGFYETISILTGLDIPYVSILPTSSSLSDTIELYKNMSLHTMKELFGRNIEGVVIKNKQGESFKVINLEYDSKK